MSLHQISSLAVLLNLMQSRLTAQVQKIMRGQLLFEKRPISNEIDVKL